MANVIGQQMSTELLPLDQMPPRALDMAKDARVDGSRFVNSEGLLDLVLDRICDRRKAHVFALVRNAGASSNPQYSRTSQTPQAASPVPDDDLIQGCAALIALSERTAATPSAQPEVVKVQGCSKRR